MAFAAVMEFFLRPHSMQFRIFHLFAATAWLAAVFALYRLHPAIALLACPVTLGPLGGYVVAKSIEGAILGFVSAVFWCVLLSLLGGVVLFGILAALGAHGTADQTPVWLFPICFVYLAACSLLGDTLVDVLPFGRERIRGHRLAVRSESGQCIATEL